MKFRDISCGYSPDKKLMAFGLGKAAHSTAYLCIFGQVK
jgi:hypothetical protein